MPNLIYRAHGASASTINRQKKTVSVIAATENPVRIFDWDHGLVDEVLLMSGAVLPENGQIVLADSHRTYSTSTIIGSCRNLEIAGPELLGVAHFARNADEKWQLIEDGHLTDFSVGYSIDPKETVFIPDGETAVVDGREWTGPILLRKKWHPKELSLVPIGADVAAKARGYNMSNSSQGPTEPAAGGTPNAEKAVLAERERVADIAGLCKSHGFDSMAPKFINDGTSIESARAAVLDAIVARERAEGHPATMSLDDYGSAGRSYPFGGREDIWSAAAIDGMALRAGVSLDPQEIARGADEFRHMSLVEIAADCLSGNAVSTRGLSPSKVAQRAMQTSDFPHLLGAVGDRILTKEFQNQSGTWRPISNLMPASDFRERTAVDLHDLSGLHETHEGQPYLYGGFSDKKAAVYSIVKHGRIYGLSLEAVVNDELDGFGRMFRHFGQLAGGLVNRSVLGILSGNPDMQDGVALFHADHSNLASVVGAPSESTISEGLTGVARQPDIEGHPLGLRGRYILVPPEKEIVARKVIYSDASSAAAGNSGIRNPLAGMGLDVLSDAALTDSDEWYVVSNPRQTDTIHAAFLDGVDRPTVSQREGFEIDGMEYKVRIIFGCAAVSYRAFWKNAGA